MSYRDNPGNLITRQNLRLAELDSAKVYLPDVNPDLPSPLLRASQASSFLIACLLGAEKARDHAASYRDFRVGASALVAYQFGYTRSFRFIHGANMKPVQGSDIINIHAEHTLLGRIENDLREGETAEVAVLAVVGDIQPDQQSAKETLTLHPCGVCREAFMEPGSPVTDETLFVTANNTLTTLEWFSLDALKKIHAGEEAVTGLVRFDDRPAFFNMPDWYLEGQERGFIVPPLHELEVDLEAERIYDEQIRFPVLFYVMEEYLRQAEARMAQGS